MMSFTPGRSSVAAVLLALATFNAQAAGVLDRIKAGGHLVLAHRDASIPFSYLDADGKPVGYAIDLCLRLAEVIRKKAGVRDLPIDYVKVTAADRMDVIAQGKADLECGSTTNNAERREKGAFTVPHFIVGARILVRANSTVTRLEDLSNKTGGPAGGAFRAGDERFFVVRRRGSKNFFLINSLVQCTKNRIGSRFLSLVRALRRQFQRILPNLVNPCSNFIRSFSFTTLLLRTKKLFQ